MQRRPRPRESKLTWTSYCSMQTFSQSMPNMRGTRLFTSRQHLTPTHTYKAVLRKDPGGFCTSHSMTAWFFSFSPCSPTARLSKNGTISQTSSRDPSTSACVSLCSMWSSLTPTSCSYLAGITAQVQSPAQFPWMGHLLRLIWGVTFFGCVHIHGRISSTFTRKVQHPWTCVCFSCLLRLLSAHVPKKDPVHNPRKKPQGQERKQEAWYQIYSQGFQESLHQEVLQPLR